MDETLRSELVGTAGLTLAACAACVLAWRRIPVATRVEDWRRAAVLLSVGLMFQVAHFSEEYVTGFYARYPPMFGLWPWSSNFFLTFNLMWIAIWMIAALGLWVRHSAAFLPTWFFSIAAMANGVAHPLLAAHAGGYFPGLVTSPLVGIIGVLACVQLVSMTEPQPSRMSWRSVALLFEAITFTVVVPGAVTYWIPRDLLGLWGETVGARWFVSPVAAVLLLVLGLAVYGRCLWEFASRGRGIPAPLDHPKQLVVTGLYRYVRNPMYVGVLLVLLGESVLFESSSFLLYTIGWLAFIHVHVILYEEPNLRRKFGSAYDRYTLNVHRWTPGKKYCV